MCEKANIPGYKTNHSLRATTATRLYVEGIDEQLVMERTGHRSIEGVRSYKRTSSEQQENISDILNGKKPRITDSENQLVLAPLNLPDSVPPPASSPLSLAIPTPYSHSMTANNISTQQNATSSTDHAGAFYLT